MLKDIIFWNISAKKGCYSGRETMKVFAKFMSSSAVENMMLQCPWAWSLNTRSVLAAANLQENVYECSCLNLFLVGPLAARRWGTYKDALTRMHRYIKFWLLQWTVRHCIYMILASFPKLIIPYYASNAVIILVSLTFSILVEYCSWYVWLGSMHLSPITACWYITQ